jgi:hypothetical protein
METGTIVGQNERLSAKSAETIQGKSCTTESVHKLYRPKVRCAKPDVPGENRLLVVD